MVPCYKKLYLIVYTLSHVILYSRSIDQYLPHAKFMEYGGGKMRKYITEVLSTGSTVADDVQ